MEIPNGVTQIGRVRGKEVQFSYHEGRLSIRHEHHEEHVEDRCVIAIMNYGSPSPGVDNDGTAQSILMVKSDDSLSKAACPFELLDVTGLPGSFVQDHAYVGFPPHLQSMQKTNPSNVHSNIHVVISTRSGLGLAEGFFDATVHPFLAKLGLDNAYQVHKTTSETTIIELAESIFLPQAKSGVAQTIMLLSGDGAIADLVNVFHTCPMSVEERGSFVKPTVGLIPMGTGNALANSAGINSDSTHGLRHFFRGTPHEIPVFKAIFSPGSELLIDEARKSEPLSSDPESGNGAMYGAVVCSWGLHASLVGDSDTTEYRKHGSERFSMAANELLAPSNGSPSHVYRGQVTPIINSENGKSAPLKPPLGSEHMYVLATMVSHLEQTLDISPLSKPLDGQMRLLHFGPMSAERVMSVMGLAFTDASHVTDHAITYQPIDGLRITFDEADPRWRRVCVDGKIVRVGGGGWVEVTRCEESLLSLLVMD